MPWSVTSSISISAGASFMTARSSAVLVEPLRRAPDIERIFMNELAAETGDAFEHGGRVPARDAPRALGTIWPGRGSQHYGRHRVSIAEEYRHWIQNAVGQLGRSGRNCDRYAYRHAELECDRASGGADQCIGLDQCVL